MIYLKILDVPACDASPSEVGATDPHWAPRGPQKHGGSMGWKDLNETYKCAKYDPPKFIDPDPLIYDLKV